MADRKVSESEFIADNTMAGGPMPQGMVTEGNEIPKDGGKPERKVDQTYWSLVKHQYRKNSSTETCFKKFIDTCNYFIRRYFTKSCRRFYNCRINIQYSGYRSAWFPGVDCP